MARAIVMIHGMTGGGWYWEKYRSYFENRGYSCTTPTLRFHDVDPGFTGRPPTLIEDVVEQ